MGSAFAQAVIGIDAPRVALLSNGEEPGKGTPDLVGVHEQLAGARGAGLNFIGNIEGTQVTEGVADVVVMDGFTGNITLKLIEGVSSRALRLVGEMADGLAARPARRAGCSRPRCSGCARRSTPRGPAAPTCSGCASSASSPTAASAPAASPGRSTSPPAACSTT